MIYGSLMLHGHQVPYWTLTQIFCRTQVEIKEIFPHNLKRIKAYNWGCVAVSSHSNELAGSRPYPASWAKTGKFQNGRIWEDI